MMEGYYSLLERFWEVIAGSVHPNLPREIPLITSLLYYSTAILLGRLLRHLVRTLGPDRYKPLLYDTVLTFQVLACSLENGQIRKHYGYGAYGTALFSLWFWFYMTSPEGRANPCSYVIEFTRGKMTLRDLATRTLCMLGGGLSSYQFARVFWSLSLTDSHMERYAATHCVTDLTVSVTAGFSVESLCTFLDTILCLNTFTSLALWEDITKCIYGVLLTVYGVHLTGMYLNPLNATNQTFGCDGITTMEHISIYWIGPLLATAVATKTNDLVLGQRSRDGNDDVRTPMDDAMNKSSRKEQKGNVYKRGLQKIVKKSTEVADDWVFVAPEPEVGKKPGVSRRLRNREVLIAK